MRKIVTAFISGRVFDFKKKNEDEIRLNKISNIVSFVNFLLSSVALVMYFSFYLFTTKDLQGDVPLSILFFWVLFLLFFLLSKIGYTKISTVGLISVLILAGGYMSIKWGSDVPMSISVFIISIVIGGILLGSRFSILLSFCLAVFIFTISKLQGEGALHYDNYWLSTPPDFTDGIMISIIFFIIATISWLSNREIEKSLKRARNSEKELMKERDMLEERVAERTKELELEQLERIKSLHRFADFGRLASGLLHDLINPLSAVSLNLEHLSAQQKSTSSHHKDLSDQKDAKEIKKIVKRAMEGTERMEAYVEAARKQLQQQDIIKRFNPHRELLDALKILEHRITMQHIKIHISADEKISLSGNPIKFYQVVTNLLSNSIDALKQSNKDHKKIEITIQKKKNTLNIMIKDNGIGIPENLKDKIFDSFFTTKNAKEGTGLGLSMCKNIIENDFKGTISVRSTEGAFTTFQIHIPV